MKTKKATKIQQRLSPAIVETIVSALDASIAQPKIELDYYSHFTLMVSVILSAQSTDKGVNKVTPKLFSLADTPEKMVTLGEEKVAEIIKSLGLYRSKARNIVGASRVLIEKFAGQLPNSMTELLSIPGIGRKSANVLLNCLFDQPTIAVDTHVFRVSNRIGLASSNNVKKTEEDLLAIIPERFMKHVHHLLVLHGRYTCKAQKPKCAECVVKPYCLYFNENNR